MREISANIRTLIQSDNVVHFYMVKVGTELVHTTLQRDIVFDGNTYLGNSGLMSVDPPRLTSVVDREAYKVTYTDPTFQYRPLFEEGYIGKPISIYLGFFNTTDSTLGGAAPGEPLLDPDDVLIAYKGTVDNQAYSIDMENQEASLVIEGASPMTALGLIRTIVTSKDNLRQFNSSDNSYDQIFKGSKGIDLLWGKRKE
jgi:hypothetical protein